MDNKVEPTVQQAPKKLALAGFRRTVRSVLLFIITVTLVCSTAIAIAGVWGLFGFKADDVVWKAVATCLLIVCGGAGSVKSLTIANEIENAH
jgi:hypothetical protein